MGDIPRKLNRISEVLDEQERSMQWLARKTLISYPTIFKYCNNLAQPNLIKLKVIANVLGVKMKDLIVEEDS